MKDLVLTNNIWNSEGYWNTALPGYFAPKIDHVKLFDQVAFDLCDLEQMYAKINNAPLGKFGPYRASIQQPWFDQSDKIEGTVLNHSNLFERKGYTGEALSQLKMWTKHFPLIWQLIRVRPKWGLDFSMDYVDCYGNCLEILHWEYDGYNHDAMLEIKSKIESALYNIDWEDAGKRVLAKKGEWGSLEYTEQCDWKCDYFGVPREQYQMSAWE